MPKAFEFCLPTAAKVVPDSPDWLHEIKYDGYRLRVEHQGRDVRLLTRNGHNWADRFLVMRSRTAGSSYTRAGPMSPAI